MNIQKLAIATAIAAALITACAPEKKPEGVIPEGYKNSLKKAEGVEGQLEDALQMQGEKINESER